MFGGGTVPPWAFVLLSLAIVVALLIWLRRAETRWTSVSIGLVIGGALGNVVDRLTFGAVFDFLDIPAGGWHWPAFHLAVSAIRFRVVLLLVESFLPQPQVFK